MGLLFHPPEEPPRAFAFASFWVFHLSPQHPSGVLLLFSEDAREIAASHFFSFFKRYFSCFSSFLVISAAASSEPLPPSCHPYSFVESLQSHRRTAAPQLVLFARYQEMQPLFLAAAQLMKVEWKIRPYFGMLALVFRAREMWSFCWAQGITQTPGLAITPIAEACIGQGALVNHHHDPHSLEF